MKLEQLLEYDRITVQCHDNPDADALASGFGIYCYCKAAGKDVTFFYSGRSALSKPNLAAMVKLLDIPVLYVPKPKPVTGLLVTVDCQYGSGNVTRVEADAVCVIDHHIQAIEPPALHDIRPYLASCSTLVWRLLLDAGFEPDQRLDTALYYGLFTDSKGLEEIGHPLDRDLRDTAKASQSIVKTLKNCNLTLDDLTITSAGLNTLAYHADGRFVLVNVPPCDPNILGFISDFVMQVEGVDMAVVFSVDTPEIKFSVRSIVREHKASDVAAFIAGNGAGSGGGHADKAGGRLYREKLENLVPGTPPEQFLEQRVTDYLRAYTVIDCVRPEQALLSYPEKEKTAFADFSRLRLYEKLPATLAYVPCSGLFPEGSILDVRMLEGDISLTAGPDTYLMIGLEGEVYPIARTTFEANYSSVDGPADLSHLGYAPVVMNRNLGLRVALTAHAKTCIAEGGSLIEAVPLDGPVKVFTSWDTENYIKGEVGDWLVIRPDNPGDWYVITAKRFPQLYRKVEGTG